MKEELTYYDYVTIFLNTRRELIRARKNFIIANENLIREQNRRFKDIDDKFYSDKNNK